MYSLSLDYVFNRVYDVLLWLKYTWLFVMLRRDKGEYLLAVKDETWDGLRDRGWFDSYMESIHATVPKAEEHISLWQRLLDVLGLGRSNIGHLSNAQIKERFESDYSFVDHIRDIFGMPPQDSDHDGVPDSYEDAHGLDKRVVDSDRDGIADGKELTLGTDPLNNDTDHDRVLDGRDEAPLDSSISSIGPDSDHDGVSDEIEKQLGTDIHAMDSDGDGIPDGMDTYPLDPQNIDQLGSFDFAKATEGLHFSIQNPLLSFLSDLVSITALVLIAILAYAAIRWFIVFMQSLDHYDHHFEHGDHDAAHGSYHVVTHTEPNPVGIPGLAVSEEEPSFGTVVEKKEELSHPKFEIIRGYMNSTSEALWRIGIMEADNLLGETLREKGYEGDGVGEMLKNASFKTVQLAWDAHKVRNRIAHDGSSFQLTAHEAKRVFNLYESVLRELKVV
jgi:hypothetical protein